MARAREIWGKRGGPGSTREIVEIWPDREGDTTGHLCSLLLPTTTISEHPSPRLPLPPRAPATLNEDDSEEAWAARPQEHSLRRPDLPKNPGHNWWYTAALFTRDYRTRWAEYLKVRERRQRGIQGMGQKREGEHAGASVERRDEHEFIREWIRIRGNTCKTWICGYGYPVRVYP
ncbi:hypothetical protein BD410DRAFT_799222 [Rickenella mellea]|uniref:Uncharacterized protein n=1 Tax=Rickenella mellea TaxID=50990 RepID=A0A4Y7QKT8_9AGAM|nr:hypothetical protein BD410DRAFT_799222 [Rickenella mellea]